MLLCCMSSYADVALWGPSHSKQEKGTEEMQSPRTHTQMHHDVVMLKQHQHRHWANTTADEMRAITLSVRHT